MQVENASPVIFTSNLSNKSDRLIADGVAVTDVGPRHILKGLGRARFQLFFNLRGTDDDGATDRILYLGRRP